MFLSIIAEIDKKLTSHLRSADVFISASVMLTALTDLMKLTSLMSLETVFLQQSQVIIGCMTESIVKVLLACEALALPLTTNGVYCYSRFNPSR